MLLCAKGSCEAVAPFGVIFGALTLIDEMRELRGYDKVFILPLMAKLLIPADDITENINEAAKFKKSLQRNKEILDYLKREDSFVESLLDHNIINSEEAKAWKDSIKNNVTLTEADSTQLKSDILSNIEKLNEIRKNNKK